MIRSAELGPGGNLRSMFSHWLWAPGPKTTSPRLRGAQPSAARWRERGGLAEFASRCFRRSPCRSSSQRHRRRSWRRIRISEDRRVTAGVEACTPRRRAPAAPRARTIGPLLCIIDRNKRRSPRACSHRRSLTRFASLGRGGVAVKPCKEFAASRRRGAACVLSLWAESGRIWAQCCQISLAVAELRHVVREEISA